MRRMMFLLAVLVLLALAARILRAQSNPRYSSPDHATPAFADPDVWSSEEPEPSLPKGGLRHGRWLSRRW